MSKRETEDDRKREQAIFALIRKKLPSGYALGKMPTYSTYDGCVYDVKSKRPIAVVEIRWSRKPHDNAIISMNKLASIANLARIHPYGIKSYYIFVWGDFDKAVPHEIHWFDLKKFHSNDYAFFDGGWRNDGSDGEIFLKIPVKDMRQFEEFPHE